MKIFKSVALICALSANATAATASDFPHNKAVEFLYTWPSGLAVGKVYGSQSNDKSATLYFEGRNDKCGHGTWKLRALRMDDGTWFVSGLIAPPGVLCQCGWFNRMVNLTSY